MGDGIAIRHLNLGRHPKSPYPVLDLAWIPFINWSPFCQYKDMPYLVGPCECMLDTFPGEGRRCPHWNGDRNDHLLGKVVAHQQQGDAEPHDIHAHVRKEAGECLELLQPPELVLLLCQLRPALPHASHFLWSRWP